VDAPGNDGNASMPEQVKRPNPWSGDDDDAFYFRCYLCFCEKLFFIINFLTSNHVRQNQVYRQEGEETSDFEDNFWQLSFTIFMFQIAVLKSLCMSNYASSLCSGEW
jgi:hypothetical protein